MITESNSTFEGVLIPAGWDNKDNINQACLFTKDDEDILLKHSGGIKQLKPFLNQKVRVLGDIRSDSHNERTLLIRKITRIVDGFPKPVFKGMNTLIAA
jgi:hypothetical protein